VTDLSVVGDLIHCRQRCQGRTCVVCTGWIALGRKQLQGSAHVAALLKRGHTLNQAVDRCPKPCSSSPIRPVSLRSPPGRKTQTNAYPTGHTRPDHSARALWTHRVQPASTRTRKKPPAQNPEPRHPPRPPRANRNTFAGIPRMPVKAQLVRVLAHPVRIRKLELPRGECAVRDRHEGGQGRRRRCSETPIASWSRRRLRWAARPTVSAACVIRSSSRTLAQTRGCTACDVSSLV
jgi:hypothetical protein